MPCPYKKGAGFGRGMACHALSQPFDQSQLFLKSVSERPKKSRSKGSQTRVEITRNVE